MDQLKILSFVLLSRALHVVETIFAFYVSAKLVWTQQWTSFITTGIVDSGCGTQRGTI